MNRDKEVGQIQQAFMEVATKEEKNVFLKVATKSEEEVFAFFGKKKDEIINNFIIAWTNECLKRGIMPPIQLDNN